MSFQPDGSEKVNLNLTDVSFPEIEEEETDPELTYRSLGLLERARAAAASVSSEESISYSDADLAELQKPDLRTLLFEAVGRHCDYRHQQAVIITDERRVNRILHVVGQWLNDRGLEQSISRDSAGLALAELAEEVRQMIQWPEFLAKEAAREVEDHARAMEWMRL